jgi:hypothetical protein
MRAFKHLPLTLLVLLSACNFNPLLAGKPDPSARIALYEGNDGTQDFVCRLNVPLSRVDSFAYPFTGSQACQNDEARSLILYNVPAGLQVQLFDDRSCTRSDSTTLIVVKRDVQMKVIGTFESEGVDNDVDVRLLERGNLDGKVSCVIVGFGS